MGKTTFIDKIKATKGKTVEFVGTDIVADNIRVRKTPSTSDSLATKENVDNIQASVTTLEDRILGKYITGLEISNNVSDSQHDIDIAPGICKDSTGNEVLELTQGLTKQLDVEWAEGNNAGGRITEDNPPLLGDAYKMVTAVNATYWGISRLNDTQAISVYREVGTAHAAVINISGSSATSGTPRQFTSNGYYLKVTGLTDSQALVVYTRFDDASRNGAACVLDIAGSVVTEGSLTIFASPGEIISTNITRLSNTKALVTYYLTGGNSYAQILTVTGSTVSAGTAYQFSTGNVSPAHAVISESKVVVTYADVDNSYFLTSAILNIDGSTITSTTPVVLANYRPVGPASAAITDTRILITYGNYTDSVGEYCIIDVTNDIITVENITIFIKSYVTSTGLYKISNTKFLFGWMFSTIWLFGSYLSIDNNGNVYMSGSNLLRNRSGSGVEMCVLTSSYGACLNRNPLDTNDLECHAVSLTSNDIQANRLYYTWLIRKDIDGSMDILFSSSLTSPTMPLGYTYKRRLRGAFLTDGTGNIIGFKQIGNRFDYSYPLLSISDTTPSTSTDTEVCPFIPLELPVEARMSIRMRDATTTYANVYGCDQVIHRTPVEDEADFTVQAAGRSYTEFSRLLENGTIRYQVSNSTMDSFEIWVLGFYDPAQD